MWSFSNSSGATVLIGRYLAACKVLSTSDSLKLTTQAYIFKWALWSFLWQKKGICLAFLPSETWGSQIKNSIEIAYHS